jgi:hypothetical protein
MFADGMHGCDGRKEENVVMKKVCRLNPAERGLLLRNSDQKTHS